MSSKIVSAHQLHFCARNRSVQTEDAAKWVTNLRGKLEEPAADQHFYYAGYISGPYLASRLVADRNSFEIPSEATGGVLWANLHLLFWLSLIPFVTGGWGQIISRRRRRRCMAWCC